MPEQPDLRRLPSVHELLQRLNSSTQQFPHQVVVAEIRRVIDQAREQLRSGEAHIQNGKSIEALAQQALDALTRPSLKRVINATGVVLHTNLGRAPLAAEEILHGYSNLEYDLAAGKRGKRDVHAGALLERLLGYPAIVVNNNAAAIYLALRELAEGYEVIVSRGELIEIGDGFRIPDIMRNSGAVLREVGTTNRTTIDDYRDAVTGRTRVLLRVHPSNFRIEGFTARPQLPELAALGKEKGIPVYEDLGSGCMVDLRASGVEEPLVAESLAAGADLVSFSGDKLLGGPQAGIVAGKPELVGRLRRNPMFRALRVDKLICQILEKTLRHLVLEQWDEIPALRMIRLSDQQIRGRAERLVEKIPRLRARLLAGQSVIGGGSTPARSLPTCLIAIQADDVCAWERRLRLGEPPVIARIEDNQLILDLRTVAVDEEEKLVAALAALSAGSEVGTPAPRQARS